MVAEGSCAIIWTMYFVWISRNAFYFIYFTILLNILALIGCLYITESPRYLFGMERFEDCKKVLTLIAARNGVKDYKEPVFDDEDVLFIEEEVELTNKINPSGPVALPEQQFEHLIEN